MFLKKKPHKDLVSVNSFEGRVTSGYTLESGAVCAGPSRRKRGGRRNVQFLEM